MPSGAPLGHAEAICIHHVNVRAPSRSLTKTTRFPLQGVLLPLRDAESLTWEELVGSDSPLPEGSASLYPEARLLELATASRSGRRHTKSAFGGRSVPS